jgi:hypothetical protein
MEKITLQTGNKGAAEAAYGAAEADGIAYGKAEDPLPYSGAGTDIGNAVIHEALDSSRETASLDDLGIAAAGRTWLHIVAFSTADTISFFIGGSKIEFDRISARGPLAVCINPARHEFNLDELMLDETAAVSFDLFAANTAAHIPWAALDYTEKHFVLEAQDPALVHTNIFESEQFKEAVYAVIDGRS